MKKYLNHLISFVKYRKLNKPIQKEISIIKILRGAEGDELTGLEYVYLTGDIFRTSTKVIEGPQYQLLVKYSELGDNVFHEPFFSQTEYFKNALESINYVGDYFPEARNPKDIVNVARRFIYSYYSKDISNFNHIGHNRFEELIVVRPIFNSDCFQIVSGNHRIASHYINGKDKIEAIVLDGTTHTYFTNEVNKVNWDNGLILYQPIPLPEFENWILIRNCKDRLKKINDFLKDFNYKINNKTIIDIGSYYGWFVNEFSKMGFNSYALEKDYSACEVSKRLYQIDDSNIFNLPIETFVVKDYNKFNIVVFMSVLHHFVMGKSFLTAELLFRKLSDITIDIMFFEMGEEHEEMFKGKLSGWNIKTIEEFIIRNSDFKKIVKLGRDNDNKGKHTNDYQRMLFALIKN